MSSAKQINICIGVDVDAVAGWLGSYGGQDSPNDIQRGIFAGEVGTLRLLALFARAGIRTTWFIPGHSLETFPTRWARSSPQVTRSARTAMRTRTQFR